MCPSTWASSVDWWLRLKIQRRAPSAARATSTTPMITKAVRRRPPGFTASVTRGGGVLAPGSRLVSGSIVVAIKSLVSVQVQGLVGRPRHAGRARQRHARARRGESGVDVRIPRANQVRLRVDHFDVAGDTGHIEVIDAQSNLIDRKSTRLNSSHGYISYAVFCL